MKTKNSQNQFLNRFWLQNDPFGAPFSHPKRSKNDVEKTSKTRCEKLSKMSTLDAEIRNPPQPRRPFPPNTPILGFALHSNSNRFKQA